jgi:hypothetical protein
VNSPACGGGEQEPWHEVRVGVQIPVINERWLEIICTLVFS